jgi:hypothetical protein
MDPCAKGSLLLGAVVTVRRLRDRGQVSATALAARLSGPALDLLDAKVDIGRWYPVGLLCELLEVDWDVGGRRDPDYLRTEGERAADRLFDSKLYQQLRYAEEAAPGETGDALLRQAKLITSITGALYNFLGFEVRLVGQGSSRRWSSTRVRPDLVAFRMDLPERLAGKAPADRPAPGGAGRAGAGAAD